MGVSSVHSMINVASDVDTIKKNDPEIVFQGWMISSSPVATPFEHPIYDVWVKECKMAS